MAEVYSFLEKYRGRFENFLEEASKDLKCPSRRGRIRPRQAIEWNKRCPLPILNLCHGALHTQRLSVHVMSISTLREDSPLPPPLLPPACRRRTPGPAWTASRCPRCPPRPPLRRRQLGKTPYSSGGEAPSLSDNVFDHVNQH